MIYRWSGRLHNDRGAIRQHLGDAGGDLVGVVPDADDGVGPQLLRLLEHEPEGVSPGLLTEGGVKGDVAAEEGLNRRADCPDDAPRSDHDLPDEAEVACDAITGKLIGRRDERGVNVEIGVAL